MTAYRALSALLFWLAFAPAARACAYDVETSGPYAWSGGDNNGYDPFDPAVYYQPFTLNVRATSGSCSFYATVSAAQNGADGTLTGAGGTLQFSVYRDASGSLSLMPAPLATETQVLSGNAAQGGGSVKFPLVYALPAQQAAAPGTYMGFIYISVYEGTYGNGILRSQEHVPVSILVPSIAEISFSQGVFDPNQGSYIVAFNTMHQGDIKGVTLHAHSNGGYRVLARSQNGGVMAVTDPTDTSTVPYTMSVDGQHYPLGNTDSQVAMFAGITDPGGKPHRFDFQIGSLGNASAGDYRDVITLTILSLR